MSRAEKIEKAAKDLLDAVRDLYGDGDYIKTSKEIAIIANAKALRAALGVGEVKP